MGHRALRLLVVDDDEYDRLAMRRVLGKIPGTEVHSVATCQAARQLVTQEPFDCAFIDYRLPDGDGIALVHTLHADHPEMALVIMTGFGDESLAVRALKSGAIDYLPKNSLNAERLEETLRAALRQRDTAAGNVREPAALTRAINGAADSVMITGPDGLIRFVNSAFTALTGWSAEEAVGRPTNLLKSGKQPPEVYADLWKTIADGGVWRGELINRRKDGSLFTAALTIAPVLDAEGTLEGYVATHRDVTGEREAARELELRANTDGLTGVANRRYFTERLEEELSRSRRYLHPLCLMLVDLDHFKQVNDRHGHLAGDAVLREAARLIREQTRSTDLVGRYGGEEFCVLLPETPLDRAVALAERVRQALAGQRHGGNGTAFVVTGSIGVVERSERTLRPDDLLGEADGALYAAKRNGRNRVEVASGRSAVNQCGTLAASLRNESP